MCFAEGRAVRIFLIFFDSENRESFVVSPSERQRRTLPPYPGKGRETVVVARDKDGMMRSERIHGLLAQPDALAGDVAERLFEQTVETSRTIDRKDGSWYASAVLFMLQDPPACAPEQGPSLVLNKRSNLVPQPGDLCCPGGGISSRWDPRLVPLFRIPGSPLARWPRLCEFPTTRHHRRNLALLLSTALREGFEEMRLLPRNLSFLGLLPRQRLRLMRRAIFPVVVRLHRPQSFRANWEVASVVSIPLRNLLDPGHYARVRVHLEGNSEANEHLRDDFPCLRLQEAGVTEILWGATYRITTVFLERVFQFSPPETSALPLIRATLSPDYLTGRRR